MAKHRRKHKPRKKLWRLNIHSWRDVYLIDLSRDVVQMVGRRTDQYIPILEGIRPIGALSNERAQLTREEISQVTMWLPKSEWRL